MAKKILHVNIADKIATYQKRDGDIVCGNSDYEIVFAFDSEWDGKEKKTARFIWGGQCFDVEFTGDTCDVPVVTKTTEVKVGVYAGDLMTTTPANIICKPSILCDVVTPTAENDKYYANEARESRDRAEAAADRAAADATEAAEAEVVRLVGELGVVQNPGDSETAVMSQKAVSRTVDDFYLTERVTSDLFQQGWIYSGELADNPNRIVMTNYVPNDVVAVKSENGFVFAIYAYLAGKYKGFWRNGAFYVSGTAEYFSGLYLPKIREAYEGYNFILQVKRTDEAEITPSDSTNIIFCRAKDGEDVTTNKIPWRTGYYICAGSGEEGGGGKNEYFYSSEFVSVKGYDSVTLAIPCVTAEKATSGMAFYDENKNYICGHGYSVGNAERGAKTVEYYIPENAVYMRTTWWLTKYGFGSQFICQRNKYEKKSCLLSPVPKNKGILNAIKRAKQLTDIPFEVMESGKVAMRYRDSGYNIAFGFYDKKTYNGIPYSYIMDDDTWVGDHILIETFLSAMRDVNSVLYTKRATKQASAYYGTVCNGLVRYALNIPVNYETREFTKIDGMEKIANRGNYSEYDIQLADILLNGDTIGHVAIVTDILCDVHGRVRLIEVAESVSPTAKRVKYPVADFFEHWEEYDLCRYSYLAGIPYATNNGSYVEDEKGEPFVYNEILSVDRGNKSNYKRGDSVKVHFYGSTSDYSSVIVEKDGAQYSTISLTSDVIYTLSNLPVGYYRAYATGAMAQSEAVEFAVVGATLTATATEANVTVSFEVADGESVPLFIGFKGIQNSKTTPFLTEDEVNAKTFTRPIKARSIRLCCRNRYGVWCSDYLAF